MVKKREFDKYAPGYSGGNEDPLKRFFGQNLDQFIYVKAKWLWNYLAQEKKSLNKRCHLLDYGCGTGEMLKWLKIFGFSGQLHGADISQAMLDEAKRRWDTTPKPIFSCIGEIKTDFNTNSFDYIVATSVFHHIEPHNRDAVLQEIKRILVPGGKVIVFEHNPLNPLTRFVVRRAAIDKNALLLYPKEIISRFQKTILAICRLDYLMFFPPSIKFFQKIEKYLGWCPMGAQYVAVGKKHFDDFNNS